MGKYGKYKKKTLYLSKSLFLQYVTIYFLGKNLLVGDVLKDSSIKKKRFGFQKKKKNNNNYTTTKRSKQTSQFLLFLKK